MNRTELILKIVYWSAITLAAILKTRSARRLARCLLPAFLCAHIERDVWVRGRGFYRVKLRQIDYRVQMGLNYNGSCRIFSSLEISRMNSYPQSMCILVLIRQPCPRDMFLNKRACVHHEAIDFSPLLL